MFLFFPKNGQQQCSLLFHESCISGKNLDLQLLPEMLSINQIVRFFDHQYLWKESLIAQIFFLEIIIKGRLHLGLLLFLWCGYLCFSSSQIVGFFLNFILPENIHQEKVASETAFLFRCGQVWVSSDQIAGSFDHSYLWK